MNKTRSPSHGNPRPPSSCDTFVALPPATSGCIIFGKNSDRPDDEAQHVVAYPGGSHPQGSTVKCTYISIPQATITHTVILSKPSWMWGAEMAANNHGLVIGNEAVWTVEPDGQEALLGMDLVRLAAERCTTAESAVDTIAELLETHGQGGGCEEGGDWSYHNSFLTADRREAWVMETAGRWWVAERVTQGVRNISNCLSIRTNFDKCSTGLKEYALSAGLWKPKKQGHDNNENIKEEEFDWAACFSSGPVPPKGKKSSGREASGLRLMEQESSTSSFFSVDSMMRILRDCDCGICMTGGGFRSNGSQVSIIYTDNNNNSIQHSGNEDHINALHWFTGTPDPSKSVFKPLVFPVNITQEEKQWADSINKHAAELWNKADRAQSSKNRRQWNATETSVGRKLEDLEKESMLKKNSWSPDYYSELVARELEIYSSL